MLQLINRLMSRYKTRLALAVGLLLGTIVSAPMLQTVLAGNDRGPNTCDTAAAASTLAWSDTSADYRASVKGERWSEWVTNPNPASCSGTWTSNANTTVLSVTDYWGREMTVADNGSGSWTFTAVDDKITGKAYLVTMEAKENGIVGPREPITGSAQRSTGPAGGYEVKDASTVLCEWFDTDGRIANASIINVTVGGDDVIYSAFNIRGDALNNNSGALSQTNQAPTGRRVLVCVHEPEENGDGLLFNGATLVVPATPTATPAPTATP